MKGSLANIIFIANITVDSCLLVPFLMESRNQQIMYSVVLTELGILILDGEKISKTIPFSNPAPEFLAIKKGEDDLYEVIKFFQNHDGEVVTNDNSIMGLLKKESIDIHLMQEYELEKIQSTDHLIYFIK